jgi:hypothetical protein
MAVKSLALRPIRMARPSVMKAIPTSASAGTNCSVAFAAVRDMLICCGEHRCSHSTTVSADRWPGMFWAIA